MDSHFKKSKTAKLITPQDWNTAIINRVSSAKTDYISTVLSPEYIKWRYATNPLFSYNYFINGEQFLLIIRYKPHTYAGELRITDFIVLNDNADARYINKRVAHLLHDFCKKYSIGFITLSGRQYQHNQQFFKWMGVVPVQAAEPIVTLKNLNLNGSFDSFLNAAN